MSENYRLIELSRELWEIARYREVLEQHIPALKMNAELRTAGRRPEDVAKMTDEEQISDLNILITAYGVVPRYYRGPFIITLWSMLESGVEEVARHVAARKAIDLQLSDIRGRTNRERWEKYFTKVLHWDLTFDQAMWQQFEELYELRNAFAHANGRVDRLTEGAKDKIQRWAQEKRGIDIKLDMIFPSEEYVRGAVNLVQAELLKLIRRAEGT